MLEQLSFLVGVFSVPFKIFNCVKNRKQEQGYEKWLKKIKRSLQEKIINSKESRFNPPAILRSHQFHIETDGSTLEFNFATRATKEHELLSDKTCNDSILNLYLVEKDFERACQLREER